jgi:hypothetical protein
MTKKVEDDKTFINYTSISVGWSDAVQVANFEHKIDRTQLSNKQLKKICECKAVNETSKLLKGKIEFVNTTYWSKEKKEAHRAKQDEINKKLNIYTNRMYGSCLIKNNLGGK